MTQTSRVPELKIQNWYAPHNYCSARFLIILPMGKCAFGDNDKGHDFQYVGNVSWLFLQGQKKTWV